MLKGGQLLKFQNILKENHSLLEGIYNIQDIRVNLPAMT
mgnify:CR=1 FL=1